MKTLKLREGKGSVQGYTTSKWWSLVLNSGIFDSKAPSPTSALHHSFAQAGDLGLNSIPPSPLNPTQHQNLDSNGMQTSFSSNLCPGLLR